MPGVQNPVTVNARGAVVRSKETLASIIPARFRPHLSTNPWNTVLGLGGPDTTYAAPTEATMATLRAHATTVYSALESQGRARLLSVDFEVPPGEGKLKVIIRHLLLGRRPAEVETVEFFL